MWHLVAHNSGAYTDVYFDTLADAEQRLARLLSPGQHIKAIDSAWWDTQAGVIHYGDRKVGTYSLVFWPSAASANHVRQLADA